MEIVQDNTIKIEDIPQLMHEKVQDFFYSLGVPPEEIEQQSQNRWSACMQYIYNNLFCNCMHLLRLGADNRKDSIYSYINNYSVSYNMDNLYKIMQVYCFLCNSYSKEISIHNYCLLLNINTNVLFAWNVPDKSNPLKHVIYKTLTENHEKSLSDKLISSKNGGVAILGALNHYFNWSMPSVRVNTQQQQALSVADLPKLGDASADCTKQKILPDS